MRKIILICLLSVLGIVANAKDKKETVNLTTTTFVTDIDCDGCVKKINNNISALGKGIMDVDVDLKAKEVKVTYNTKKNTDAKIITGFSKIDVKAKVKTTPGKPVSNSSSKPNSSSKNNSSSRR